MKKPATVLASVTRAVIDFGASRGIDRARLVAACGSDARNLDSREGRVSRTSDAAVWSVLTSHLGSHGVGVAFAATAPGPRAYGVVTLRDMTAATFGHALRRHCRHHRVLKQDVAAYLVESPRSATVVLATPSGQLGATPAAAEAAIAPYAVHARAWTGKDVSPEEVRFEHAAPEDTTALDELFRCPIHFDQTATSVRFSREVLDLPLTHAHADLCEFLDASAERELTRLREGDLAELVYHVVATLLGHAEVHAGSVARELGMGVRTLQRRLKDEGVRFQDVVDSVRHHRALELVLDPSEPMVAISDRLGFSDARAFRRAFRRWTGMSPDRYRRMRGVSRAA